MTLFIISIPLMLIAIGIAVVPLLALSHREARHIAHEFEHRLEQHRLAHQTHHHAHAHSAHRDHRTLEHTAPGKTESVRTHEPALVQQG